MAMGGTPEISINYDDVLAMSSKFIEAFDTLQNSKAALAQIREGVQNAGLVGAMGLMLGQFMEMLENSVDTLKGVMAEESVDLNNVVLIMRDKDGTVASKFYE